MPNMPDFAEDLAAVSPVPLAPLYLQLQLLQLQLHLHLRPEVPVPFLLFNFKRRHGTLLELVG